MCTVLGIPISTAAYTHTHTHNTACVNIKPNSRNVINLFYRATKTPSTLTFIYTSLLQLTCATARARSALRTRPMLYMAHPLSIPPRHTPKHRADTQLSQNIHTHTENTSNWKKTRKRHIVDKSAKTTPSLHTLTSSVWVCLGVCVCVRVCVLCVHAGFTVCRMVFGFLRVLLSQRPAGNCGLNTHTHTHKFHRQCAARTRLSGWIEVDMNRGTTRLEMRDIYKCNTLKRSLFFPPGPAGCSLFTVKSNQSGEQIPYRQIWLGVFETFRFGIEWDYLCDLMWIVQNTNKTRDN